MRSLADTEAGRVVRPPVPTRLLGGRDWVTGPVNRWFVRSYTEHDQVPDWLSTDLVADAARKLALVHRVASTFDPGVWCPPVGGLQVYDWGVADSLDRPEALIEDMRRRGRTPGHIRSVTARLDLLGAERVGLDLGPEGLTHHDLRTENLLVRGGEVVEIVDWDRAHWDVQWYDVTLAGLHLAYLQPAGLRWDLARVFLDAYQAESQVKLTPDALSWLFRYTAVRNLAVSRSPGKWAHLMKGVDERWGSRPSVFVDDLIA